MALCGRGAGPLSGPMRRTRARSTAALSFAPSGQGWAGTGIRYGSINPLRDSSSGRVRRRRQSRGREGLPGAKRRSLPPWHVCRRRGPIAGRGQEKGVQQVAIQLAGLVGWHGRRLVGCPVAGAAPRAERRPDAGGGHGACHYAHRLRQLRRRLQPRRHRLLPRVARRDGLPVGPTPMHRVAAYFAEVPTLRVVCMWPQVFNVSPPRELTNGAVAATDSTLSPRSALPALHPQRAGTLCVRRPRLRPRHRLRHQAGAAVAEPPPDPHHARGSLGARADHRRRRVKTGAAGDRCAAGAHGHRARARVRVPCRGGPPRGRPPVDAPREAHRVVAVNCVLAAHRLHRDEIGAAVADFLGLMRSTGATILLLGEHEDALNSGRWEARFARATVLCCGIRRRGGGRAGGRQPCEGQGGGDVRAGDPQCGGIRGRGPLREARDLRRVAVAHAGRQVP
jgi:hypothetical protein